MLRRYGVAYLALVMSLLAMGLGGCGLLTPSRAGTRLDHTAPRVELLRPRMHYGTSAARPQARSRLRGFGVVRKGEPIAERLIVSGRVTDDTGVARLFVNGREVQVESSGQFYTQLPLVSGENTLHIRATDTYNNVSDITFTIVVGN